MFAKLYKSFFSFFLFMYFLGGATVFGNNDFRVNLFFKRAEQLLGEVVAEEQEINFSSVLDFSNTTLPDSQKQNNQDFIEHIDLSENIAEKEEFTKKDFRKSNFFKQMQFLLSKFSFYRFSCRDMSSFKLSCLLKEIDVGQDRFLNDKDKISLSEEDVEKINIVFDLLRKGIACQLCFDHLLNFREKLLYQLNELFLLIDYWSLELEDDSFLNRMKKGFSTPDMDLLVIGLKELNLLKDRTACYLGKVEEIFLRFFKTIDSYSVLQDDNHAFSDQIFNDLTVFIREGVFSLDSFFTQNFDPDGKIYNENFKKFEEFSLDEVIKLLCKNHTNIGLMDDFFDVVVNDYQIPSFFTRHWLLMSLGGMAALGGSAYLYLNWDWLMSDEESSPKNRAVKMYNDSKNWLQDSIIKFKDMIKEKFGIGEKNSNDEAVNAQEKKISELADKVEAQAKYFSDLAEGKSKDKEDQKDVDVAREKLNQSADKCGPSIDKLCKDWKAEFGELGDGGAAAVDQVDINHLLKVIQSLGTALKRAGKGTLGSLEIPLEVLINKISRLTTEQLSVVFNDLKDVILNITDVVKDLLEYGKLEGPNLAKNLGVFLSIIHTILQVVLEKKLITKVDEIQRGVSVTQNWIKYYIPLLLLSAVVVTGFILIIKNIIKKRRVNRYNKVNSVVSEIYRILTYYKSNAFDYYNNELKYKDQGLIGYWIDKLSEKAETVSREDKNKLLKLIVDLQNTDLSVGQKAELIKLEWGKNLFGSGVIA